MSGFVFIKYQPLIFLSLIKLTYMKLKFSFLPVIIFLVVNTICSSTINAQKKLNDYTSQWEKVDQFQKKGLTKSALAEVDNIYSSAKKSENEPQIIKALLFKITLQQNIIEDASVKSIDSLEQQIATAKEPAKSILQS